MLLELQQDFRRLLLGGDDAVAATAVKGDGLAPEARLRIYRNHVVLSLREALRTTFPVVHRLVGEEFFAVLARDFIAAHPPQSPCLSDYGVTFGDFIAAFAPAASLPYLADMARLEWAMNAAYHVRSELACDSAALSAVDPALLARSSLKLQPSLQIVVSAYPIETIWRANQPDSDGSGVDLADGGCWLLVWRQGDDAVFQAVDPEMAVLVDWLLAGEPLGQALEAAARVGSFDAGTALGRLLVHGLIAGLPGVPPVSGR